jgi:acyl-coenzyme A synthetase/AMP-(fatty) acid ligase
MATARSAHIDPFCREHLPPREQWPQLWFDLPELQYPEHLNAAQALLSGPPDNRPCVRGSGEEWTYGELRRRAHQIAAVLIDDLGLVPGNRVLLRGPNEPWLVACWLATLLAGGVAVPTMPMLRTAELIAIAELAQPRRVPAAGGRQHVLLDRTTPEQLADAVAAEGVTVIFTAPTAYRAILAAGRADRLAGLRRAMSAGETLPAAVWHAVHEATGLRIIDGIGSTEMLHVFISAADDDIRPGCTGRAVPGYRAAVLDDNGDPVPDGTPGHFAVQGPTGCRYLHGDRQQTYVRHGWNHTGDTFVRDADGYFTYLARSDDMIVSSGYNISGPEVEQALLGHRDVIDCAVIGTPDGRRGAVVTAYVVLREGAAPDAAALQHFTKQVIAPYKYPRVVEFVPELPRTSTGKLQRFVLRERARDREGRG